MLQFKSVHFAFYTFNATLAASVEKIYRCQRLSTSEGFDGRVSQSSPVITAAGDAAVNLQQSFQVLETRERAAGVTAPEPSHYPPSHGSFIDRRLSSRRRSRRFEEQVARGGEGVGGKRGRRGARTDQSGFSPRHTHTHTHRACEIATVTCRFAVARLWSERSDSLAQDFSQFEMTGQPNVTHSRWAPFPLPPLHEPHRLLLRPDCLAQTLNHGYVNLPMTYEAHCRTVCLLIRPGTACAGSRWQPDVALDFYEFLVNLLLVQILGGPAPSLWSYYVNSC